jgi:hypothetical protein
MTYRLSSNEPSQFFLSASRKCIMLLFYNGWPDLFYVLRALCYQRVRLMDDQNISRFTESLSKSVDSLFKTGGFALAFGFSGIVMILGAKLLGQEESTLIIVIGAVLTFSCLGFFLYTTLKGNSEVTTAIKDNREAIDAVQDISIQLTRLVNVAQAYSFKNINKINNALKIAAPALKLIPFLGDKISVYELDNAGLISQSIVENSERIEQLVNDIESALINADHSKLKEYSKEVSILVINLKDQLKK